MSEQTIRIALVDDHPLLLEGVVHVLSQEPDIEVIGTGTNAREAVTLATGQLPDIMLLDMNMPGDGLNALDEIATQCPLVRVIALTVREDHQVVKKALTLGARAYVLKGVHTQELLSIIRTVYEGGSFISMSLASKLLENPESRPPLTERETEILDGIGRGLSNKEIAIELDLQEKTIKHYVTNILQKLQVRNRVEAAILINSDGSRTHKPDP